MTKNRSCPRHRRLMVLPVLLSLYCVLTNYITLSSLVGFVLFRQWPDDAKYSCLYDNTANSNGNNSPIPVVLLAGGRTGSHATWQVMSRLTGLETKSKEYRSVAFFRSVTDEMWLVDALCTLRYKFSSAGIVGVKWVTEGGPKVAHKSSGAMAALEFLRAHHYRVKVIRLRRNVLDVVISQTKHIQARTNKETATKAHCLRGNDDCMKKHMEASTGMTLPTKDLLARMRKLHRNENGFEYLLEEVEVPHLMVSYEKLYGGGDTALDEWGRVFKYLGVGPKQEDLTMDMIEDSMSLVPTHHFRHNATLGNYDEVREFLSKTEFEGLLH